MIKVKVLHNQSPGDGDTLHNYTTIITMYSSETVFVSAASAKSEESQESPTVLTLTKVLQLAQFNRVLQF